ncbi:MAG: PAS domain S-box protein [Sedimentisphaerales bacterium]|nr:PAS domain S-box protein [Sedimentisphaerales bacterium]
MTLFWRIYLAVLTCFAVIIGMISYVMSNREISDAHDRIIEQHTTIGRLVANDIERAQAESEWPFENLRTLSKSHDFLFWWVVRPDGTIHLADNASSVGTVARDHFPAMANVTTQGRVFLDTQRQRAVFAVPFGVGTSRWTFWLGFSTRQMAQITRDIVGWTLLFSGSVLAALGAILYFIIGHLISPIRKLAEGAAMIGKGDLTHRVPVESSDEIGQLARSFNSMMEHLRATTTSIDNLNREIAERKRIEDELRFSEERFRAIFEYAPDAYFLHDTQGRLVDINKKAEQMIGYERDEQIGHTIFELGMVPPDDTDKVRALVAASASGNPDVTRELTLKRKDGVLITAEITTLPVRIKGVPVVLGIARDITERRRTEKNLRDSEERFRQVAECAGEFIWEVDADGLYTYANPVVERVLGYKPEEIVGKKRFYDLFVPEERDRLKTLVLAGFASRESFQGFVSSKVHRDGHTVILETSGTPVVDSYGNLMGYRGVDNDITNRSLAEEKLRQQKELLKNVISHIPHFVFWKDEDSVYLGCNEVFARSAGVGDPEHIVGKTDYDLVWKDNADSYRRDDKQVMDSGEPLLNFEESQTREDGRQIALLTSKVPLRDASGRVTGVLGIYADITDRKQAEDRLAYLASFPERNPNPIMEVELDGTIHYMNPAAASLFPDLPERGLEHPWLTNWSAVVQPFQEGQTDACMRDVTIGERSYEQLLRYFARDHIIRIYATDITDRRHAVEALQFKNIVLSTEQEVSLDGIMVVDETATILSSNTRFLDMWGVSQRIVGLKCEEFVRMLVLDKVVDPAGLLDKVKFLYAHPQETGRDEILLKDGRIFDRYSAPMHGPDAKYYGRVWYFRDITERKRAEQNLHRSEAQLSNAVKMAHLGPWEYDAINDVFAFNDSFYAIFRTTADRVGGYMMPSAEYARRFVHPEDMYLVADETRKAIETEDPNFSRMLEHRVVFADGEVGYITVRFFIVKDEKGRTVRTYGVNQDITERKHAEQRQERLLEQLAKANQELKDFVYIASHDLRAPVRKIVSFGQLLQESLADKLADDDRENLEFMIEGAARMHELIEALLVYSRISTREVQFDTVDLNQIVEELRLVELAIPLEESHGTLSIPEPLPLVHGDCVQIRQLLQNLVANGLKYHKKEVAPQVTVRAQQWDDGMIRVNVEDNGIGIDPQYYDKLFIMFRRLHSSAEYEGTGIGLAVCKKIIERHRGQIGIESTPGEGSSFWFTLPAPPGCKEQQEPVMASAEPVNAIIQGDRI